MIEHRVGVSRGGLHVGRSAVAALIVCGGVLLACKSDKFTGTYKGAATLESKTGGDRTVTGEKSYPEVSMVLEGNSEKNFILHLVFGADSPIKNCKWSIDNDALHPGRPLDDMFLTYPVRDGKNADHTCENRMGRETLQGEVPYSGAVRLGIPRHEAELDTLTPGGEMDFAFKFKGERKK